MPRYECTCYDLTSSVAYPRWVKTFTASSVTAAIAAASADTDFVAGNTIGNVRLLSGTLGTDAGIATDTDLVSIVDTIASPSVSTGNSSTTPLGAAGVFTGSSESMLQHGYLAITCYADVASATNGLEVQASADGTTWFTIRQYTVHAGQPFDAIVPIPAEFGRVRYTNGSASQSTFLLHAVKRHITSARAPEQALYTAINLSTSGDTTVIAAPGTGRQLAISTVVLHNPAATDNTVIIRAGTSAINGAGFLLTPGVTWTTNHRCPLILPTNTAFVLNLSASTSITGYVVYQIV